MPTTPSPRQSHEPRPDPASQNCNERGGSVIEFAIIAPLLIFLLFGIIDAGWLFNQQLEVRHGAREGARLAAVNAGTDAVVASSTCTRMHFSGDESITTVTITRSGADVGDTIAVTVSAPYNSLTGFLDPFFGSLTLTSTVDSRLEQPARDGLGTGTAIACAP